MFKIDLVVPYVDCNDTKWKELYNKYNTNSVLTEEVNAVSRFRGQGDFFKYFFRCIAKNLNWINNVFLLVQSESQVPSWINRDKIKVITHEQFIPKDFLPTFNSTCIEMFLWNIPGLGEHFLYANDDIFVTQPIGDFSFFTEDDKIRTNFINTHDLKTMYGHHKVNTYTTVYNVNVNEVYSTDTCPCVQHLIRPYIKSVMFECYKKYESKILESISKFREEKNLNVYLYDYYTTKIGRQAKREMVCGKCLFPHHDDSHIYDVLFSDNYNMICIQDNSDKINIYENVLINDFFKYRFGIKCKYEV